MARLYAHMFPRLVQVECPMELCHLHRSCKFPAQCEDGGGYMLVPKKQQYKSYYKAEPQVFQTHTHERAVVAHVGRIKLIEEYGLLRDVMRTWSDDQILLRWECEANKSFQQLSDLAEEYMRIKYDEVPF